MNDELSRNVGKSRADSMGWEYVLASGPVGGSHYLIPEIRDDGSPESLGVKIVALQRLEPYDCHAGFARRQARTCGMPVLFGGARHSRNAYGAGGIHEIDHLERAWGWLVWPQTSTSDYASIFETHTLLSHHPST